MVGIHRCALEFSKVRSRDWSPDNGGYYVCRLADTRVYISVVSQSETGNEIMNINRTTFLAMLRNAPFGGKLSTSQIDGMNAIIDAWMATRYTDLRWLAYMLATAFWETGQTMQPIREANGKTDAQTIARLDAAWKAGKLGSVKTPYWRDGWFGRGLVQITHKENYVLLGALIGIDLASNPGLALRMDVAIKIMFEGMLKGKSLRGDFTGRSLEQYFNATTEQPEQARAIINGSDKAKLIAGFYGNFLPALKASVSLLDVPTLAAALPTPQTPTVTPPIAAPATVPAPMTPVEINPEDAKPDNVPALQSKSLWTMIVAGVTGSGLSLGDATSFFGQLNNPWALAGFAFLMIGGGALAWLLFTGRLQILHGKAVN